MEDIKVLVVDDEILVRKSVTKLLKREKLQAVEAEDGYKAIELCKKEMFDIIVSDIRMPGIDGIETIKEIKKIHPNVKTIVMTGFASEDTPIEAIRLGVNDYIYKPFELEEFRHCIRRNISLIELEHEKKELEEEKIRNQKLVAVGNMTNSIVHDVKNALTPIIGFTRLIKSKNMSEEKADKFLDIILQQTNIIMDKLQDIMEFSRGNIGLIIEKTPVKRIFDDIINENEFQLEGSNIVLSKKISKELEDKEIEIDLKRIKQVYFNLISNSKDALEDIEGDKTISLDFQKEKNNLVINLRDNGKGIEQENLRKIFEPFSTFGKKYGTGLGLAIVKQVIEKLNGRIFVDSEHGKWTEFKVLLPMQELK